MSARTLMRFVFPASGGLLLGVLIVSATMRHGWLTALYAAAGLVVGVILTVCWLDASLDSVLDALIGKESP